MASWIGAFIEESECKMKRPMVLAIRPSFFCCVPLKKCILTILAPSLNDIIPASFLPRVKGRVLMTEKKDSLDEKGTFEEIGKLIDKLLMSRDSSSKERWNYIVQLFWAVVLFIAFVGSSMIIKWIGFNGFIPQIIRVILESIGAAGLIVVILQGFIMLLLKLWWNLKVFYRKSKK